MVGDLSAVYGEIDPVLACDMAPEAIGNLPRWTVGPVGVVVVTM